MDTLSQSSEIILDVENLTTEFRTSGGVGRTVDSLSFSISRGETLGIVGESGCGKSITALSILRLVPSPPGNIVDGSVRLGGVDLMQLPERQMRDVRGNEISMIFQEPMNSLNPVLSLGYQIAETLRRHEGLTRAEAKARAVEMLDLVQIPAPERRAREYPHQLSGGMRQRAMIAMALSCNPRVLIADEPTTALDVTIQAQVLDLIQELQERLGAAVILITHDLGVVAETAQRVIVMYAGRKVEEATVEALFADPLHPYTRGLLASVPRLSAAATGSAASGRDSDSAMGRLEEIPGIVPPLTEVPSGCAFAPRCGQATEQCKAAQPPLEADRPGHWTACWHVDKVAV